MITDKLINFLLSKPSYDVSPKTKNIIKYFEKYRYFVVYVHNYETNTTSDPNPRYFLYRTNHCLYFSESFIEDHIKTSKKDIQKAFKLPFMDYNLKTTSTCYIIDKEFEYPEHSFTLRFKHFNKIILFVPILSLTKKQKRELFDIFLKNNRMSEKEVKKLL